jgi:AcrR family transcriptional regulator
MVRVTAETREKTRQQLLEAAAGEFAEQGLEAANINRISTRAGFAKGTVYNYFPSKEALFLEVVREGCVRAVREAKDEPEAPTRQRLRVLLESDMAWVRRYPAFARVLLRVALSADPNMAPRMIEAAAPFLQQVERILECGRERGEVRGDVSPQELALWFVGLDDLALAQHFATEGRWPALEEIPELVVRQFLEGAGR